MRNIHEWSRFLNWKIYNFHQKYTKSKIVWFLFGNGRPSEDVEGFEKHHESYHVILMNSYGAQWNKMTFRATSSSYRLNPKRFSSQMTLFLPDFSSANQRAHFKYQFDISYFRFCCWNVRWFYCLTVCKTILSLNILKIKNRKSFKIRIGNE